MPCRLPLAVTEFQAITASFFDVLLPRYTPVLIGLTRLGIGTTVGVTTFISAMPESYPSRCNPECATAGA
jgi:hypothetical protein